MTFEHEQLAAVEPVHRDLAARGSRCLGLPFEDVFQELVVHFLETLPRYDPARGPVQRFAEWSARTLIGQKRWRRWKRQVILGPASARLVRRTDGDEDPAAIAERNELSELLRAAIGELTEKQRAAVSAAFGIGRPAAAGADLAAAIGRRAGAAHDRIRRALRQLAGAMGADPAAVLSGLGRGTGIRYARERAERDARLATLAGPTAGTIEARRARVAELRGLGLSFRNIARVVGVCRETVRADCAAARRMGRAVEKAA